MKDDSTDLARWEQMWRKTVHRELLLKLCQTIFKKRKPKVNSLNRALTALREKDCWPVDEVAAWVAAGGHKNDITFDVSVMQVPPTARLAEFKLDDTKSDTTVSQSFTNSSSSSSSSGSTLAPSSLSLDETRVLGRKSKLGSILSPASMNTSSSEDSDGSDKPGHPRMRGDSKNVLGDIGSLNDLLDVLQQNGVSFSHGLDDSLDTKKVEFLKQLLPVDLADHPSMTKEDRTDALKQFPKFNKLLPHALKKDLTHLSSRLSRLQKEQIEMLYKSQLRSRDLLRVCVGNLYTLLDPEVPVNRQSRHFNSWAEITALIIDDFVWAIKQQQKLILARHGFSDDSLAAGTSIIPLSMKTKLKEVADFRRSLGLPTQITGTMASRFFSFRGNSNRRGGFRRGPAPSREGRYADTAHSGSFTRGKSRSFAERSTFYRPRTYAGVSSLASTTSSSTGRGGGGGQTR